MNQDKPPVGIRPRKLWLSDRMDAIDEAIRKRLGTCHSIPEEWITERNMLIKLYQKGMP